MRIAIDIREALRRNPTGKGMWTKRVLEELKTRDVELISFPMPENPKTKNQKPKTFFWHLKTCLKIRSLKPDVYLSTTSYIVPWLLGKSVPTAIVVHDLIAFDREPHDKKAQLIERLTLPRVLKTAKWIFTVSEATKKDLMKRFPKTDLNKVIAVYAGPTLSAIPLPAFSPNTIRKVDDSSCRNCGYILSIGTLCPRKNQLRLIQAFNKLPDEIRNAHKLILAGGRGWDDEEIIKLAEESENVEWVGYVPDDELTELLKNAKLLAYPSLKEGFGFPVLDAMALGIPVLTSNRSSMEEIAESAGFSVDPESVEAISDGLQKLLRYQSLQQSLIDQGGKRAQLFSWKNTVDRIYLPLNCTIHIQKN